MSFLPEEFESHRKEENTEAPTFPPSFTYPEMEKRAKGQRQHVITQDNWVAIQEILDEISEETWARIRARDPWFWTDQGLYGDPSHPAERSSHVFKYETCKDHLEQH